MQLIAIDKARYRKRLNIVIISFVTALLILSLGLGSTIIAFYGDLAIENSVGEIEINNFRYNILGVILALLASIAVLHQIKDKPYLKEIYYVWKLKNLHNKIYRKAKKIKIAATDNDDALIILNFYYHSRKQVYLLDDNTLTIPELDKEIQQLDKIIAHKNLTLSLSQFKESLLNSY